MSTENILDAVWLLPALPLCGAVVLLLFGKRIGEPRAGWIAAGFLGLTFGWTAVQFFALRSLEGDAREHVSTLWSWIPVGGFQVDLGFLVDPLSITFALFITFVATLIHVYAIGYMHGDSRFSRFFAYLNLFVASMLVLVLGSNFLVTFLGWEGVGLCSYLLISFWFEKNTAAVAGKKAFVTNRVGDLGFMIGIFLIFASIGSVDYAAVPGGAAAIGGATCTAIALLLFVGAMGKSAQFPLHIWLPDAMEGPTPVSALIHAATMVTAGIFLMLRAAPFLAGSGYADDIVAWVGVFTAFFAATAALVQTDIKRVLAYSTISQLGYCILAIGAGAYAASVFHVVTHAFFKALLFLAAGSVIHGMHRVAHARGFDEQDMRWMGALRKLMPITAGTFIVGWLAIAGVFPFSGFWSKDEILAKIFISETVGASKVLWAIALVTAVLTAFYMTRQVWMVFYTNARWNNVAVPVISGASEDNPPVAHDSLDHADEVSAETPHESPPIMTGVLIVLALGACVIGLVNLPFHHFEFLTEWLEPSLIGSIPTPHTPGVTGLILALVATALAVVAIGAGIALYRRGLPTPDDDPLPKKLGPLAPFFASAWYFSAGVSWTVARVGSPMASWLARFDETIIDGAVVGSGRLARTGGDGLRRVQSGVVRNYALAILIGVVALLAYVLVRVA